MRCATLPDTVQHRRKSSALQQPVWQGRRKLWLGGIALLWLAAAANFWVWWLQPEHILHTGRFVLLTACFAWLFLLQVYFFVVVSQARRPAARLSDLGTPRVAMVVTKTPSEPFAVVRQTLEAMLAQDYPHDTWLADEDPSPETRTWCAVHGVEISTRKGVEAYHRSEWPRRTRCKEGNLAYFYDHYGYERYDFVSQLDADHVPTPTYLREMLRPFADPSVGYVSAPSICSKNAGDSWAARTRLDTEAAFHGILQAGYNGNMAPMCIGSHYAVRTVALKEVGGLGPELAEDHSTSMILNAGGWRGVHAVDAIAHGDGPASLTDLATQEFQWSRSLVTLLLRYTPRYLGRLPWHLKAQFLFCQMIYPMFALCFGTMLAVPIWAMLADARFADVTYPSFLLHSVPPVLVLTACALSLKRAGLFRPVDAPVLSWEKALFLCLQWPWVVAGCLMALRDRLTGRFVDFRITPKGDAAQRALPMRVILPYALIAATCILPVLTVYDIDQARGFLLLSLLNGAIFTAITVVIVVQYAKEAGLTLRLIPRFAGAHTLIAASLVVSLGLSLSTRGLESLYALSVGLEPFRIATVQHAVSGAGMANRNTLIFQFDPGWAD